MNLMENLWTLVKKKRPQTNNADDMKEAAKAGWTSIPALQNHRLMASMSRSSGAVIPAAGGPTKHEGQRKEQFSEIWYFC